MNATNWKKFKKNDDDDDEIFKTIILSYLIILFSLSRFRFPQIEKKKKKKLNAKQRKRLAVLEAKLMKDQQREQVLGKKAESKRKILIFFRFIDWKKIACLFITFIAIKY